MHNDRPSTEAINDICESLVETLRDRTEELFKLNRKITNDTIEDITADHTGALTYLERFPPQYERSLTMPVKPKGRVLLVLSYNEPLTMTIIPVLNSIAAGNRVFLRPSSSNYGLAKMIWAGASAANPFLRQSLTFVDAGTDKLYACLPEMNAVYFFGGSRNAKKIAAACGEHLVEFHPEIEAADVAVVEKGGVDEGASSLCASLLKQSFTHKGQVCQRIQGVFVHEEDYRQMQQCLIRAFSDDYEGAIDSRWEPSGKQRKAMAAAERDIRESGAGQVIRGTPAGYPVLVLEPDASSRFIKQAYMLPILWLRTYRDELDLLAQLKGRDYFLGLNLWADGDRFVESVMQNTRHSRYTVNRNHVEVHDDEGWGGVQPSGYGGYASWIDKFSNRYTVLRSD